MTAVPPQPPPGVAKAIPGPSRWERALIVLGICLPVPLLAATGLTIPLPATVERLAAALVPWAEAAVLDPGYSLARGSIVLTAGELRSAEESPTEIAPSASGPESGPVGQPKDGGKSSSGGGGGGGTDSKAGSTAPDGTKPTGDGGGGSETKPDGDGGDPSPAPSPIDKTIDDAGDTVTGVVDGVEGTVGGVVDEVGGTTPVGTVTGVLPGLGG